MNNLLSKTSTGPRTSMYVEFGIMMWNDPRLYRVGVSLREHDHEPHFRLPLAMLQRAILVINLTTQRYVKNRWIDPNTTHPPSETELMMFRNLELTPVPLVQRGIDLRDFHV